MVLCTYPIEHMAARTRHANPESTWRLYGALAQAAGITLPLSVSDPRVMVGGLRSAGRQIALLVNMSHEQLEVKLVTRGGSSYGKYGEDSRSPVEVLVLPPFEVEVLALLE
jgi:hypothetical protein